MASQRKLGIYWGSSGISLVELNKDVPLSSTDISFSDLESAPSVGVTRMNEDLRLLDLLQKAIHAQSFSSGNAFLSLPSKDIIVRWFVIPWVKAEEIQGVVKFEAKKHIPFPLEELVFNYYPSTINKDGVRQIGIALTAIRKVRYERYINVLVQAGINIVFSEPSAMSLLRALVFRKIINTDEVSAILTAREDSGEIAIVSQGYVKFIRDFSLRMTHLSTMENKEDAIKAKLFNEVRMSLDFFSRHNAGPDVQKVVALSSGMNRSLFDLMSEDIALPVRVVDSHQILEKSVAVPDITYVRAFGAGLSGAVPAVIEFNLSEGQLRDEEKKTAVVKSSVLVPKVFLVVMVVVTLATAFFLLHWWMNGQIRERESAKKEVSFRLKEYVDMPREQIERKIELLLKRSVAIRSLPFKSSLTPLMIRLVQLLPKGIWFEDIKFISSDNTASVNRLSGETQGSPAVRQLTAEDYYLLNTSVKMTIIGVASLYDTNAEFELVNQFVETLGSDPQMKIMFSSIKLSDLQEKSSGVNQKVTTFSIEFR